MSGNQFGKLFQYQSWGESHGPAIGCVVDGVPPRLALCEDDIQVFLNRRRPGKSRHESQRQESDRVEILSGVFEGFTTGAPISLLIKNEDARSKDYEDIKDVFRPGHADYTTHAKYGIRDFRGGGRSSARETAARVCAGAIAHVILREAIPGLVIRGAVVQIGTQKIDEANWDWDEVSRNDFFCPDAKAAARFADYLDDVRKNKSSAGAIIKLIASGVPAGLGAPCYDKLDADLAKAMMSINACKGVEIGAGFGAAMLSGAENSDAMRAGPNGLPIFESNNAGGILGGISTGQDIEMRLAFKPTSSIPQPQKTINIYGENEDIIVKGRHDPCVGIRAIPIAESMMACVLADHWLRHKAQCL